MLGGRVSKEGPFITQEEIEYLIDMSNKEGVLEPEKKEMPKRRYATFEDIINAVMFLLSEDADYITIGPIFKTRAKDYTVGPEIIKEVLK